MSRAAETAAHVEGRVAACLGGRVTAGIIEVPLSEGVSGFTGLGRSTSASEPGWIQVLPVVGVIHDQTESVVAELTGLKRRRQATWSEPLSALVPGLPVKWAFEPPVNEDLLTRLCDALTVHGLPIMRGSTTLPAIRSHLERGHGPRAPWVLPVVLGQMGEVTAARAALDRYAASLRAGPPLDEYKRFGQRLLAWLGRSPT